MAKVSNDIPTGYKKASAAAEQNARSGVEGACRMRPPNLVARARAPEWSRARADGLAAHHGPWGAHRSRAPATSGVEV